MENNKDLKIFMCNLKFNSSLWSAQQLSVFR